MFGILTNFVYTSKQFVGDSSTTSEDGPGESFDGVPEEVTETSTPKQQKPGPSQKNPVTDTPRCRGQKRARKDYVSGFSVFDRLLYFLLQG